MSHAQLVLLLQDLEQSIKLRAHLVLVVLLALNKLRLQLHISALRAFSVGKVRPVLSHLEQPAQKTLHIIHTNVTHINKLTLR